MSIFEAVAKFGTTAAALTGVVGVLLSLWLAHKQRKLQSKLALFDKQFAVYRAVEEFLMCVLRTNGSFGLLDDFRRFQDAMEQAKFLFPEKSKVIPYLIEVKGKAMKLHPLCAKRDHDVETGIVSHSPEIFELLAYFCGPAIERRNEVFSPHLQFD